METSVTIKEKEKETQRKVREDKTKTLIGLTKGSSAKPKFQKYKFTSIVVTKHLHVNGDFNNNQKEKRYFRENNTKNLKSLAKCSMMVICKAKMPKSKLTSIAVTKINMSIETSIIIKNRHRREGREEKTKKLIGLTKRSMMVICKAKMSKNKID